MTRLELQRALDEIPEDAHMEVCVRTHPNYAVDFEVADVSTVVGAQWGVITVGALICDHA